MLGLGVSALDDDDDDDDDGDDDDYYVDITTLWSLSLLLFFCLVSDFLQCYSVWFLICMFVYMVGAVVAVVVTISVI